MNLYQEVRPYNWDTVVGHSKIVKELRKRAIENNWPSAIYFSGSSGTGKTSLARIAAMSMKCTDLDLKTGNPCGKCKNCKDIMDETFIMDCFEFNGASFNKDEVSVVEQISSTKSLVTKKKVIFINEFQKVLASSKAHDDFLSILENKKNVCFILTSMDDKKTSDALKNRTVPYKLKAIDDEDVAKALVDICKKKSVLLDEIKMNVLIAIAENSKGSMRTSLMMLDRVLNGDIWTEDELFKELSIASEKTVFELTEKLLTGNEQIFYSDITDESLEQIRRMIISVYKKQMGVDLGKYRSSLIKGLHNVSNEVVDFTLETLYSLFNYSYVSKELIDYTLLKVVNGVKKLNDRPIQETPRRRAVSQQN
jgi:DNA polymerase-3 subunit gamma/tau